MGRIINDRISPRHVEACVDQCTAVAFRRRGHDFVVQVPGSENTPAMHTVKPSWDYTIDGQSRIMCLTMDVEQYINARRRTLEKHNGTLTKFARISLQYGDDLNTWPFGRTR